MNQAAPRVPDYLGHMLQALQRIERHVGHCNLAGFMASELIQDAVIRNLEVIGEASRNIERADPRFAAAHPELPLAVAGDMRNALSHGYFKIDLLIVWRTVQQDLPPLKATLEGLLQGPEGGT